NAVTVKESIRIIGSPDSSHRILCCDTIETTIRRGRFTRNFRASPDTDGTEASQRDFYATGGGLLPALLPKPGRVWHILSALNSAVTACQRRRHRQGMR